ncbi:YfhO family protein [Streptomyces sp. NPDC097619]|uniref:YfhO family protein n=1 Tax=Streptomyces sp. NPDC097619 TaxID=3157228 RepID=UPI003322105E
MAPEPTTRPAPPPLPHHAPRPGPRALRGPALAFLLTATAVVLAWAARGSRPFGPRPRALNDQANQYVPFHQGLWDLVHGQGAGDPFFSWRSGLGHQFLADYATYLANPLSWTTVLVPRHHVDLAVFALTPLTLGLAAAVMAGWLGRIAPGPWWQRGLLGACYGLCGWALCDASYIPMWQWGLVALPLLGLAVERALAGSPLPGTALLVALAWWGNFYTAMMATLAAAVLLAVRLVVLRTDPRERIRVLLRAAAAGGTGIALTLPLLLPSYLASTAAQPTRAGSFVPAPTGSFLAGLLPGGYQWGSQARLYLATLGLLLVLAFLLDGRTARRTRGAWGAAAVLTAASFQFPPTQYLWHGLAVPNGNSYRETFVLSGIMTAMAWQGLAARPRPRTLAAAAAVLAAATLLLSRTHDFAPTVPVAVLGGGALSLTGLLLWLRAGHGPGPRRRGPAAVGALLMVGAVLAESVLSGVVADQRRARESWARPRTTAGPAVEDRFAALRSVDGWPAHRTDPGRPEHSYNDGLSLRAEGPQYYSSYLPASTFRALDALGHGSTNDGRTLFGVDNPVLDAVFAIGARVSPDPARPGHWTARTFPAPPLVTVRPRPELPAAPTDSVYARQEAVLGARVYRVPPVTPGPDSPGLRRYRARCAPGTEAYWYSPALLGVLTHDGRSRDLRDRTAGVQRLGPVRADGLVEVTLRTRSPGTAPARPVGCLDRAALGAAVDRLTREGAVRTEVGGHSVRAVLPVGARGTAVVATPASPGWRCSAPLRAFHGLLAVELPPGTREFSCAFVPPGFKGGLAGAGLALAVLLATGLAARRRPR